MPDHLRSRAIRAVKWAAFAQLLPRLATPISVLVMARLLTPADFGVVASAAVFVSFSQLLWDAGLTKALVHYRGDIDAASQVVFWANMAIATALVAALFPVAPWIAENIFHDPRVGNVLRVLSSLILAQALFAVPLALIQRELAFRQSFWISLPSAISPLLVAIPLAIMGSSYWALVASTLASTAAQLALAYRISAWRPRVQFRWRIAGRLVRYGGWVSASGTLGWLFNWLDTLLIGAFFGTTTLGTFSVAKNLVDALFVTALKPVSVVLFPALSRLQADVERLRASFLTVSKLGATLAIAIFLPLALFYQEIVTVLLGPKWSEAAMFVLFLGACQALAWTVSLNGIAYRAIGRPDAEFKVMSISMLIRASLYAMALPFGLLPLMIGRLVSVALGALNHTIFAGRILGTGIGPYVANTKSASLAFATAAAFHYIVLESIMVSFGDGARLVAGSAVSASVFLLVLLLLEGKFLWRTLQLFLSSQSSVST
jgi:O-antigen/teichoic acid export membrane protein